MIISETTDVVLSPNNMKYYESKGYTIPRYKNKWGRLCCPRKTSIKVKTTDLSKGASSMVEWECEICKRKTVSQYDTISKSVYYKYNKETYCNSCILQIKHRGENHPNYKYGRQYTEYLTGAKKRGLDFDLTIEDFKKITSGKCHYCGGWNDELNKTNGIDRINSNLGYKLENCISCCSICNRMKMAMKFNDFINHIERIHKQISIGLFCHN